VKVMMGIFFVLWGLFWSGGLFFDSPVSTKLGIVVLAWAPLTSMTWFFIQRASARDKQRAALLAAVGVAPGSGWDHAEDGTAIALNPGKREVGVQVGQSFQVYPYEKVRHWEAREERPDVVVARFGVANGVAAAGAQARLAREAAANTGLFIEVKDVEAPSWRIVMKDQSTRSRWMELLRQEINEGGAVASR
jgi:hypothetical protein